MGRPILSAGKKLTGQFFPLGKDLKKALILGHLYFGNKKWLHFSHFSVNTVVVMPIEAISMR